MAIHNFYHSKLIDDANLSCGKIIMAGCDDGNTHFYVDPCEILQQCLGQRPAIDWCSMIPNIVDGQPGIPNANPGYVLRVNNAGTCVEWVPPDVAFQDTDELVKVSGNDTTAGTLIQKITTCDPNKLSITIQNPGGDEKLLLCPNIPTSITELIDVEDTFPNCAGREGTLKFSNAFVFFECDKFFASYFCTQDMNFTFPQNVIKFQGLHNQTGGPTPPTTPHFDIFKGDVNFLASAQNGCFRIPWTGMYRVYAKATMRMNYNVQAMRFAIVTTNSKKILADCKIGADPLTSIVTNLDQGAKERYDTFMCENIVYLQEGDLVATMLRIDTNVSNTMLNNYPQIPTSGRQASITIFRSTLGSGTYDDPTEFPEPRSGAQFTIQFLSKRRGDSPYLY